jgi:hypothetical protein
MASRAASRSVFVDVPSSESSAPIGAVTSGVVGDINVICAKTREIAGFSRVKEGVRARTGENF